MKMKRYIAVVLGLAIAVPIAIVASCGRILTDIFPRPRRQLTPEEETQRADAFLRNHLTDIDT